MTYLPYNGSAERGQHSREYMPETSLPKDKYGSDPRISQINPAENYKITAGASYAGSTGSYSTAGLQINGNHPDSEMYRIRSI